MWDDRSFEHFDFVSHPHSMIDLSIDELLQIPFSLTPGLVKEATRLYADNQRISCFKFSFWLGRLAWGMGMGASVLCLEGCFWWVPTRRMVGAAPGAWPSFE